MSLHTTSLSQRILGAAEAICPDDLRAHLQHVLDSILSHENCAFLNKRKLTNIIFQNWLLFSTLAKYHTSTKELTPLSRESLKIISLVESYLAKNVPLEGREKHFYHDPEQCYAYCYVFDISLSITEYGLEKLVPLFTVKCAHKDISAHTMIGDPVDLVSLTNSVSPTDLTEA